MASRLRWAHCVIFRRDDFLLSRVISRKPEVANLAISFVTRGYGDHTISQTFHSLAQKQIMLKLLSSSLFVMSSSFSCRILEFRSPG